MDRLKAAGSVALHHVDDAPRLRRSETRRLRRSEESVARGFQYPHFLMNFISAHLTLDRPAGRR